MLGAPLRIATLLPLVRDLLDFCYPGRCAACEAPCAGASAVCASCDAELAVLESAPACARCARPTAPGGPCPYCHGKGLPPYDRVLRLGVFSDPLRQLIHQMKFHHRWPLGEHLAARMRVRPDVQSVLAAAERLVPVPLHRLRQLVRGFNQAEVIARALRRVPQGTQTRRLKVVRPAVRLRHTEPQTQQQSRARRLENLRDAFGMADPESIRGRRVVLVDDVMTTGATLQSLARCLREAEPASLSAIVLAVADPKGRDFQSI